MGFSPTTSLPILRRLDLTSENSVSPTLKSSTSSASWITQRKKRLEHMSKVQVMEVRRRRWLQRRSGGKICTYSSEVWFVASVLPLLIEICKIVNREAHQFNFCSMCMVRFEFPQPTFKKLMKEHCMEPFFVFQVRDAAHCYLFAIVTYL